MGLTVCPQPDFDTPVRAYITRLVDEAGGDIAALLRLVGQDPDEWVEAEVPGIGHMEERGNR